ncbi:DUF418 domain-containing protein, partial [Bacteroides sp. UBA939]|uniref:DUF418 domain-containing protein n=1 Tax=Bacteroides sp. UBA939 TaxID=1946092 RepID=UPI0025C6F709
MVQKLEGHTRIDVADALRGLAVMGIIVLHTIEHFNFYSFPDPASQGAWLNFSDKAIWNGLFFLLSGKAYAVFALLFGFSFFIQDDNQRMRGKDFRLRFCWRLVLLFIFGNINAVFFTGEVLVLYSLVGFILPLTCRLKDKWMFILACVLLIQPLSIYYMICACMDSSFVIPSIPTDSFWGAAFEVQSHGTFFETMRVNLWEGQLASLAWAWEHGRVFQTASLFLFGLLIGRRNLFLKENLKFWNKVLCGALIAFFPLYGLGNMLPQFIMSNSILTPLLLVITSLSNFSFMLILVSGIINAFYRTNLHGLLMKITPYGKMSLTNYVTQSIIGSLIFYNWGLAMHSHAGITVSCLIGILLFACQFAFC